MSRYRYVKDDSGKLRPEHCVVWEKFMGIPIPPGHEIHHRDGNGLNNDPKNLICLTISKHRKWHALLRARGIDVVDTSNPDVINGRNYSKEWRIKNSERFRESKKKYRETHREEIRKAQAKYQPKYREEHRESINANQRRYVERNREWLNAKINLRNSIRRGDPPEEIAKREEKVRLAFEALHRDQSV